MNSWINLTALWKIVVIGLLAGAGLPALFAMARIAPVDGRSTTIELRGFFATAVRASDSIVELIVVLTTEVFTGFSSVVELPLSALPAAVVRSTARPAVP